MAIQIFWPYRVVVQIRRIPELEGFKSSFFNWSPNYFFDWFLNWFFGWILCNSFLHFIPSIHSFNSFLQFIYFKSFLRSDWFSNDCSSDKLLMNVVCWWEVPFSRIDNLSIAGQVELVNRAVKAGKGAADCTLFCAHFPTFSWHSLQHSNQQSYRQSLWHSLRSSLWHFLSVGPLRSRTSSLFAYMPANTGPLQ